MEASADTPSGFLASGGSLPLSRQLSVVSQKLGFGWVLVGSRNLGLVRENVSGLWLAWCGEPAYIVRTGCEATHRQGWHHREAVPGSHRETGSFGILEFR